MSSCQVETSLFTRKIFLTERWKLYQYRRLVSFILSYRLYFSRLTRDSILNNRNYGVVKKREEVWREDLEIWKVVIALGESGGRMVVERALRAWRTSVDQGRVKRLRWLLLVVRSPHLPLPVYQCYRALANEPIVATRPTFARLIPRVTCSFNTRLRTMGHMQNFKVRSVFGHSTGSPPICSSLSSRF